MKYSRQPEIVPPPTPEVTGSRRLARGASASPGESLTAEGAGCGSAASTPTSNTQIQTLHNVEIAPSFMTEN